MSRNTSKKSQKKEQQPVTTHGPDDEQELTWRDLVFFKKIDEDIWEAWSWAAVGILVATVIIWAVAFMRLGPQSVKAYVLIPWTGVMVLPVVVWGLIRSLLNPPIFRVSRSVAFISLMIVGVSANTPFFAAPLSTEEWKSTSTYVLPVKGQWATIAGGESLDTNMLATSPAMRYGVVLTKLKDGKRYTDDGKDLTDYHCFGQPIYAPADGKVVEVHTKIKDHAPNGEAKKGYQGNFVVLKHEASVYFFLFGLKHGSIAVKQGESVKQGQKLGECGNSGATSVPQVQFHFQNSAAFPLSEGLPVRFDYKVGQKVYEQQIPIGGTKDKPLGGQLIESMP